MTLLLAIVAATIVASVVLSMVLLVRRGNERQRRPTQSSPRSAVHDERHP